jgi:hypothetical protein
MKEIDYFKDPRMADLKDAPYLVQEVYTWRLAVQDAKAGMTPEEIDAYYEASRKETDEFCAKHGFQLKYADKVL